MSAVLVTDAAAARSTAWSGAWSGKIAAGLAVAAAALLTRPYVGLQGDARIYVGRAVADLDPGGVGRDLMWAGDGQSGYSVFPRALAALVAAVGPARADTLAAGAALALWCVAAALMLGTWAGVRRRTGLLAAALLLPAAYGGFALDYGEAAALPRPFAEALVLLGLWALGSGRARASAAFLLAATAVHPIMALPGWGVLLVVLGSDDRRWWGLAALGATAFVAAAWLRLPFAGRLLQPVDADWLAVLVRRNGPLFCGLWSSAAWARVATIAVTAALGARWLEGRLRTLILAVLGVAAVLLAASGLLGEGGRSLLVVQLQPWRGLWLLSFVAAAALPLALLGLWRAPSAAGRLAAATLAVAWASSAWAPGAGLALFAAVALAQAARRGRKLPRPVLLLGWAVTLGLAAVLAGAQGSALRLALAPPLGAAPADGLAAVLLDPWRVLAVAGGVAVFGAAAALRQEGTARDGAPLALAAILVAILAATLAAGLAACAWDHRGPDRRALDDPAAARNLRARLAARPGAVLWLGGDLQPALLAGRPAWWSEMQGASNVFSRSQAMEWARRGRRLVATGVAAPDALAPFPQVDAPALRLPTSGATARLCAAPDAPAWIVAPLEAGEGPAARRGAAVWTAPEPSSYRAADGRTVAVTRYALLPCGG